MSERNIYWHFPIYLEAYNPKVDGGRDPLFRTRPGAVVRQGRWKLHEYFEEEALELFDLEEDIGETKNIARKHPEKVKELFNALITWRKEVKAIMPRGVNELFDQQYMYSLYDSLKGY